MIRVCIADDNEEIVEFVQRALAMDPDFEVVGTASNGLECLEVVRETRPDVLVLDIVMPHLDGIGVLEHLHEELGSQKPEIIMLSAFGKDDVTKKAVTLGASYFLVKPFSISQLLLKIRELGRPENDGTRSADGQSLEMEVTYLLQQLGISPRLKGFLYLREAVLYVHERPELLNLVTKELYPMIAKEQETTPTRVERAMRHALKKAWEQGMDQHEMFHGRNGIEKGPKNSEFISYFVNYQSRQDRT